MTLTIPKPAPPKRVRCPRADKQAFTTYELSEAKRIHELGRMVERGWTKHLPTYSYKCECTFWHWTSREPNRLAELAKLVAQGD